MVFCKQLNVYLGRRDINLKRDGDEELLERKSVTGGIKDPRVIIGAFHTSVQSQGFAGQFSGCPGARVRQRAVGLTLDIAFLFPFGEISQSSQFGRILHPLDDLD